MCLWKPQRDSVGARVERDFVAFLATQARDDCKCVCGTRPMATQIRIDKLSQSLVRRGSTFSFRLALGALGVTSSDE